MIKSIKTILAQDKEKFKVPNKVQDLIPIKCIWPDGIFKIGNKFSKTYKFSDINYLVASREDKESMFLTYSELLNSLDSGATTKITINNHRLNKADFEDSILMPLKHDGLDGYRIEYNDMLLDKATGANGITQEKYMTISVAKKDIEEARAYFARVGADLTSHFANLGSKCVALNAVERLRILHDFYRPGDETAFEMNLSKKARLGHDFRDYICPDSIERTADHIKLGEKYARVLFLKDYASYIKDSMVSELTELNRNLMLSMRTSARSMSDQYRFNDDQDSQLEELLNVDNSMWLAVLYGIYGSDDMIVQVALSQIGNVGGEPYWSWYGFGSRVEWCACFVSWCADQCGYIETGVCPKYAGCVNGVAWFKEHNQWVDGSETPSPGMIIFYDWDSPNGSSGPQDGLSDHTGIVERVENGIVYTVEGNSGDSCRQCQRAVGNYEILGYGVLIP